jgi:hypothetical protein
VANHIKPDSLKVKTHTFSCRDDEYNYVKKLDPQGLKSFKRGFSELLKISGYNPDLKKISKK